jgi:tetratricopeptide (TPR) repeat protein
MRLLFILAIVSLAGCVSTNDERWRIVNDEGVQLFARGRYEEAVQFFDYALTFKPQDPVLIFNGAQCYDRLGDLKRAEEHYNLCLQLNAKFGDARLAILSVKYRTNRVAEANQQIQDWLRLEPTNADADVADAWRLRQEKAYPQAIVRLQQALSLDNTNRRALTEMGLIYEIQGMPERSYVLYERILQREPHQVDIAQRLEQLKARGVQRPLPN